MVKEIKMYVWLNEISLKKEMNTQDTAEQNLWKFLLNILEQNLPIGSFESLFYIYLNSCEYMLIVVPVFKL